MRAPTACLFAFLLGVAPVASAQNLITNGDFSSDVSGWGLTTTLSGVWDGSLDADHDQNSGSGYFENYCFIQDAPSNSSCPGFAGQCVPVPGAGKYDVGAEILFEWLWQSGLGGAFVNIYVFDGPSCTGEKVGGTATPSVYSNNSNSTVNDVWILSEELDFETPPPPCPRSSCFIPKS